MRKLIRVTTSARSLSGTQKYLMAYLNSYYNVIAAGSDIDHLTFISESVNVKVREIKMKREISPFYDLFSLYQLIKLFYNEKPDIVHANTPKGSLLAMVAARICRVPHRIYTVTGLRFETASGRFRMLLVAMEKLTCACASKVIPEGEGVKSTLIQEKITSKPLHKILNGNINGIDLIYFDKNKDVIQAMQCLKSSDFTFVFVGRMVKDKGIHELVRAFITCNGLYPSTRLLLVGELETELDPVDKDVLNQIQNHSKIQWVGYQSDVRPYLAASDVFAFGSYREGFPNVVLQAGAMALPSIVTDISGCNEIIINGINGIIIPPKNQDAMFDAMKFFVENKEKRIYMASNARKLIADRYEQTKVWEATLQMYNELYK